LKRLMVKLCVQLPYAAAMSVLEETTGIVISTSRGWRTAQTCGEQARPALKPTGSGQAIPKTAQKVGISMDGFFVNVREQGWKEVRAGSVFATQAEAEAHLNEHGHSVHAVHASAQTYVAYFGSPEGFAVKMADEVHSRKPDPTLPVVVVADGATWIRGIAERQFPNAAHIVDWYHAKQHLFAAADLIFPSDSQRAHAWVKDKSAWLYEGRANELADLITLTALHANSDTKQRLLSEAGYFANNHQRMQYLDFQNDNLPIGSGTIEAAAKLFQHRLKAAGMRWSQLGLENMLALRAAFLSNAFDSLPFSPHPLN
jgi:hypothetical protein